MCMLKERETFKRKRLIQNHNNINILNERQLIDAKYICFSLVWYEVERSKVFPPKDCFQKRSSSLSQKRQGFKCWSCCHKSKVSTFTFLVSPLQYIWSYISDSGVSSPVDSSKIKGYSQLSIDGRSIFGKINLSRVEGNYGLYLH